MALADRSIANTCPRLIRLLNSLAMAPGPQPISNILISSFNGSASTIFVSLSDNFFSICFPRILAQIKEKCHAASWHKTRNRHTDSYLVGNCLRTKFCPEFDRRSSFHDITFGYADKPHPTSAG